MTKTITSLTNPLVQQAVKLHSAKYRKRCKEFIAEGIRVISTLIDAQHKPIVIFTTDALLPQADRFASNINIVLVSQALIKKISSLDTPSDIVAIFPIPEQLPYNKIGPGVVFVELQNPGNAGTLIRTAVAMNKKTAVFVDSVDPWNPKVVQASAGAIGMINVFQLTWDELVHNNGSLSLCALVVNGGKQPETMNLSNSLIVVGNEGSGLSNKKIEQCNEKITLKMPGEFESLNASIAGSIALYLSSSPK